MQLVKVMLEDDSNVRFSDSNNNFRHGWKEKERSIHALVEMLTIMGQNILRTVASNLQATQFVSVMMDECTDFRNKEQVIVIMVLLINGNIDHASLG